MTNLERIVRIQQQARKQFPNDSAFVIDWAYGAGPFLVSDGNVVFMCASESQQAEVASRARKKYPDRAIRLVKLEQDYGK